MSIPDRSAEQVWTYAEYAKLPADRLRHEIVGGRHHMNPSPSTRHQTISRRIQFQLYQQIELTGRGQVFNAPIDLQLSDTDIVQPDIVVVLAENKIITPSRIAGVPDLVIEILSKTNRNHDLITKRALYERYAIPEYWTIETGADEAHTEKTKREKARAEETRAGVPAEVSVLRHFLVGNEYETAAHTSQIIYEPTASTVKLG